MATRRNNPPPVYQSEPRCRPYQPIPSGIARKTRVKMNSASSISPETAPLRATAMPIWVKNATTARKRVIHQSVLGRVLKNTIIVLQGYSRLNNGRTEAPGDPVGYAADSVQ